MKCYGKRYQIEPEKCNACELEPWCKNAADPPLLGKNQLHENITEHLDTPAAEAIEEATYTRAQVIQLVRFMLKISDTRIKLVLLDKLEDPDISLSIIARSFNVKKQAIGQKIERTCKEFPELSTILKNRPNYNKWRKPGAKNHPKQSTHFRVSINVSGWAVKY